MQKGKNQLQEKEGFPEYTDFWMCPGSVPALGFKQNQIMYPQLAKSHVDL